MLLLILCGREFGVSSNLRTMCSIAGAGKFSSFFRFNWKEQSWNLTFALGSIIGGYLSSVYLMDNQELRIASDSVLSGGMLVGFGARYAGGCTSGHAISGLSNFQLPSLIAVCGFFLGGLVMTWLIIPMIFN